MAKSRGSGVDADCRRVSPGPADSGADRGGRLSDRTIEHGLRRRSEDNDVLLSRACCTELRTNKKGGTTKGTRRTSISTEDKSQIHRACNRLELPCELSHCHVLTRHDAI